MQLRTHFKEVLHALFSYSLIKRNDVIPAYKLWISFGMNVVNNDVNMSKDIQSHFEADEYMYKQFN